MLGISDSGIWLAYILCIISALICVVYGFINWNKGNESEPDTNSEKWDEEEQRIEEIL